MLALFSHARVSKYTGLQIHWFTGLQMNWFTKSPLTVFGPAASELLLAWKPVCSPNAALPHVSASFSPAKCFQRVLNSTETVL